MPATALIATLIAATTLGVPVGGNEEARFYVTAPEGWSTSGEGFAAQDHRWVYAAMSNRTDRIPRVVARVDTITVAGPLIYPLELGRDVAPTDSLRLFGGRTFHRHYVPEAFEEQLEPGTVYVDVGVFHGGPPPASVYVYRPETGSEARIRELRDERPVAWETPRSVGYRVSFGRWGKGWDVVIAARKPFAARDLESAFGAVASIRFPEAPVVTSAQALEAASRRLPDHMRPEAGLDCDLPFHFDALVDSLEGAFRVEFRILDGTRARSVVRRCAYRVVRDGTIEPIEPIECPKEDIH